jgi:hypothetical protein
VNGNSWEALAWAARQKTGGPGPKAVLLSLAKRVDEDWSCYPGQDTLAEETEQSVRTVRDQLKRLEEAGLIRRETRGRSGGGRTSDRYFLQVMSKPADPAGKGGKPADPAGQTGSSLPVYTGSSLPGNNQGEQPGKNNQIADSDSISAPRPGHDGEQVELIPVMEPVVRQPKTRAKPKRFLPDDWRPNAAHVATAKEQGWTRDRFTHEVDQFRNYWQAQGRPMADWDACFRTWMNNAQRWAQERGQRNGFTPTTTHRPQPTTGGMVIEGPAAY